MNTRTTHTPCPHGPRHTPRGALSLALRRRNALVEAHRHLVPPLAHHYWRRCPAPQDDLIQVGWLGLLRAAELVRPAERTPFAAFARPHIRGAILHYLRDDALPVRLPRRQAEMRIRLRRLEEELARQPGAPSSGDRERLRDLGVTEEQWRLLRRHELLCRPAPLEPDLVEGLAPPAEEGVEEGLESEARVEALLAGLDPRTQRVVRWVVLRGWSYRRVGSALEVSAMTVQRCLRQGLATLRHQLAEADRDDRTHPRQDGPRPPSISPGARIGRVPSAAQGWPSRHSPPPAAAPAHRARR